MASKEKLYERRLQRPLNDTLKSEILAMFEARRNEIPVDVDIRWHPNDPVLSLNGPMGVSIHAHFQESREILEVFVEMGFAARMLVTERHREKAREVIHDIADELKL